MIAWIKKKMIWLTGALIALVSIYLIGRKDGKNVQKLVQKEKTIKWTAVARHIDNMPDSNIDSLPSKYD